MKLTIGKGTAIHSSSNDILTGQSDPDTGSVLVIFSTTVTLQRSHSGIDVVCHVICKGKDLVSSEPQPVSVLGEYYFFCSN